MLRWALLGAGLYVLYRALVALTAWISVPGLGALQVVAWLVAIVLGGVWFHRVGNNLDLLDRGDRTWSTGSGVAFWYVPLANLVLPYFIVKEWYRASGQDWREAAAPKYLTAWWLLWAGAGALALVALAWGFLAGASSIDLGQSQAEIEEATQEAADAIATELAILHTVSAVLVLGAAVLYVRLCKDLAARQDELIEAKHG